ncbi:phenylacetic acid degradation operon negative regulatory protein [Cryobacterium mesophilum]|uniref:Regulator n=1 Tax=Terrimesophilobacter mesophilus TaxID=433647 RepID=A0A4R8VAQ3_9MICO|nr:PaaX family transcriptional regulator C-terminal domain-containing protein [Terrimesophilobacter mesophilus]MBB5633266.1 phenylacetic acid degradation operon negative regulatory protein [Terrimesophilobacter mesophilus]TFB80009.1 regulator [Terrimesophilobacter mesophilus]
MILDDFDARPGSATSLLRTIVGSYLRGLGGAVSVAELIRLLDAVGVSSSHARTAVLRVKNKGLLLPVTVNGQAGYRLNPDAVPMLERGDRRIFNLRQQRNGGPWCLVSFSLPESERAARHQIRKRLAWIGCGMVATGLWICPASLTDEVEAIFLDLRLRHAATLFITDTPQPNGPLADAVRRWWDLDAVADLHRRFIREFGGWGPVGDPRSAFANYVVMLDRWRVIPYLDPGLQPAVLPADWPGFESLALFDRLRWELAPAADRFVGG